VVEYIHTELTVVSGVLRQTDARVSVRSISHTRSTVLTSSTPTRIVSYIRTVLLQPRSGALGPKNSFKPAVKTALSLRELTTIKQVKNFVTSEKVCSYRRK